MHTQNYADLKRNNNKIRRSTGTISSGAENKRNVIAVRTGSMEICDVHRGEKKM